MALAQQTNFGYDAPFVAVDPESGFIYLAATIVSVFSSPYVDYSTTIVFTTSFDGGKTWTPSQSLSSEYSNFAQVAVGPDGEVYVCWEDFDQQSLILALRGYEWVDSAG